MTPTETEKLLNEACSRIEDYLEDPSRSGWGELGTGGFAPILEDLVSAVRLATLEEAAQAAERAWREASNVRPTYVQNSIAAGCVVSAAAIRALRSEQ